MGKGKGPLESWVAVIRPGERAVRSGRRDGSRGARIPAAGGNEAADQDKVHLAAPDGELSTPEILVMKKTQRKEIQEKTLAELLADGRNWRQEIFQPAPAASQRPTREAGASAHTAPRHRPD